MSLRTIFQNRGSTLIAVKKINRHSFSSYLFDVQVLTHLFRDCGFDIFNQSRFFTNQPFSVHFLKRYLSFTEYLSSLYAHKILLSRKFFYFSKFCNNRSRLWSVCDFLHRLVITNIHPLFKYFGKKSSCSFIVLTKEVDFLWTKFNQR